MTLPTDPAAPIGGLFVDKAAASAAVRALMAAGFDPSRDIHVHASDARAPEDVPIPDTIEFIKGSHIGAAIGTVGGAAGAITMATGLVARGPRALMPRAERDGARRLLEDAAALSLWAAPQGGFGVSVLVGTRPLQAGAGDVSCAWSRPSRRRPGR